MAVYLVLVGLVTVRSACVRIVIVITNNKTSNSTICPELEPSRRDVRLRTIIQTSPLNITARDIFSVGPMIKTGNFLLILCSSPWAMASSARNILLNGKSSENWTSSAEKIDTMNNKWFGSFVADWRKNH